MSEIPDNIDKVEIISGKILDKLEELQNIKIDSVLQLHAQYTDEYSQLLDSTTEDLYARLLSLFNKISSEVEKHNSQEMQVISQHRFSPTRFIPIPMQRQSPVKTDDDDWVNIFRRGLPEPLSGEYAGERQVPDSIPAGFQLLAPPQKVKKPQEDATRDWRDVDTREGFEATLKKFNFFAEQADKYQLIKKLSVKYTRLNEFARSIAEPELDFQRGELETLSVEQLQALNEQAQKKIEQIVSWQQRASFKR